MHDSDDARALGLRPGFDRSDVHAAYRERALVMHPDLGGTDEQMTRLNAARDRLLSQLDSDGDSDAASVTTAIVREDALEHDDRDEVRLRFYLVPLLGFPLLFIFLVALANTVAG